MMKENAPVVIFTYNRLDHLKETVESLLKNEEAVCSDVFFYSDAAKDERQREAVKGVRKYISAVTGFHKIHIMERECNWGLRRNIIDGVTNVIDQYGRVIVLEDDVVVSPYFLRYMNDALEIYKEEERVFQVSGYTSPFEKEGLSDTFFLSVGDCWGWGIWKDRWERFVRDPSNAVLGADREWIHKFNLDGSRYRWQQIMCNADHTLDTWAIFAELAMFRSETLCLYARESLASNTGNDESGTNSGHTEIYNTETAVMPVESFTSDIQADGKAEARMKAWCAQNETMHSELNKYLDDIVINVLKGRKLALWGMGANGKIIWQELCWPEFRDIEVELFDGGKLKDYYKDAALLKDQSEEYYVLVTISSGEEMVKAVLEDYGYCFREDFDIAAWHVSFERKL